MMLQTQDKEKLLYEKNWLKFKLKTINDLLKNRQYKDDSEFKELVNAKNVTLVRFYDLLRELLK